MASDGPKCIICDHDLATSPGGFVMEFSCGKICDTCFYKEGTFCHKYHRDFDGWRKCDICGWKLHYGCIMSENMYDMTEKGLTCYDCLKKMNLPSTVYSVNGSQVVFYGRKLQTISAPTPQAASELGAPSSVPNSVNFYKVDDSSGSENVTGKENVTDQQTVMVLDNCPQNPGNAAATEGNVEPPQLEMSSLTFLFEKQLTKTDCDRRSGCMRLPIEIAETLLPMPPGQQDMPFVIKDAEGRTWNLHQRWYPHGKGRLYVIGGIGKYFRVKQCKKGDILKFYRQVSDGELVMELIRNHASTSTS
ncbi:hypothetical protein RND81_12G206200 [Saponaria officinalis]|uniref:TF-B3 domain-containing protein n=1 Tax=Saponaria officinalis TaxID=3572 RepID=A0AAW1HD99_SAPOF